MRSRGLFMADTEELHEVPAVHTNAIGTPAVGGTEPTRPKLIFRITSMTRPVTAAQSRTQVERTNSAPRHDERAACQTSQNRTFCAYCTVHPTRAQDAQSRRCADVGTIADGCSSCEGSG
jgi:hypothetical protein